MGPELLSAQFTVSVPTLLLPFAVAETFTLVCPPTGAVFRVKVPVVLPADAVNCAGMEATASDPLTIVRVTGVSLASTRPNVTFPSELVPPVTVAGVKLTDVGVFGFRVRLPVLLPPFAVALTCTVVDTGTSLVTVLHVPLLLPAGTIMLLGMEATAEAPLRMFSATTVSLLTARPNVTFPVLLAPPITTLGAKLTKVGLFTVAVKIPVLLPPFAVALTCTVVATETSLVTMLQVPLLLPAGTMMLPGSEATAEAPLTTFSVTRVSLPTARPNVTLPTLLAPPITEVGTRLTAVGVFTVAVKVPVLLPPFAAAKT